MSYTNNVQTLLDDDTVQKLNRLILIEAFERGDSPKSKSDWVRELITETVNHPHTLRKIEEYKPKHK